MEYLMTTENQVATPATPPAISTNSPVVMNEDPPAAPDPAAPPSTPDPNPVPPLVVEPEGVQKRINELTAKRYEAERKAEAAEKAQLAAEEKAKELLAQIAKAPADGVKPDPKLTEEEIERRATEKATLMAQAKVFNDACDTIAGNGKKEFTDWDEAVKNLNLVGIVGQGASPVFLETAIELKNPQKILHHLGKNLDEAERIKKLSPPKMALELARIESQVNAPVPTVPISNAPPPVIPVGGATKGVPDINDPNLPMEEFMALRAKQKEDYRRRYQK
jgi:hypothetical protein